MKLSRFLLGTSLALNLAFVAAFFAGRTSAPAPVSAPSPKSAPDAGAAKASSSAVADKAWAALQSDDPAEQIARLRAEGFPQSIINAIIRAQISATFAPRQKALSDMANTANQPPWKSPTRDPQYQAASRALSQEMQAAFRAALGPDADNSTRTSILREHPYLSADKADQIAGIRERYNNMQSEMLAGVSGSLTRIESDKLTALDKAMQDEILSVLSPAEREEYAMRASNAGSTVRSQLEAFDATEQEFRALYRIEAAYQDANPAFTGSGPTPPEEIERRREAARVRDESIKALFTPERYADYQRAIDSNYRNTTRLVTRLGLPDTTANDVYAVQKDLQARATEIARDNRTPEQFNQAIAPLAAEAQTRITGLLGASGYEAYKQYGGSWMQTLAPRQPPAAGRGGGEAGRAGSATTTTFTGGTIILR